MKLAEDSGLYYPDIVGRTTVESLFVALVRNLLEVQPDKDINSTGITVVSALDTDEVNENLSVSLENIYGRYVAAGFKVSESFTNDFSPGLKSWPFGATGPIQAMVDLRFYLHDLELENDETPRINFNMENGDGENIVLLKIDADFELELLTPRSLGVNTAKEYLLIDQSI